ncbi:hypothetical protein Syun_025816 [Stephania yunnanensis]|uniref:Uncharacterized protein n=1 Tax=Stephania yunnanensis TaxID=152371 RepID=A0AAP0ET48_9MAGN
MWETSMKGIISLIQKSTPSSFTYIYEKNGGSLSDKAKLQRRRQELTQTTPDQSVDDEAVYYKVAGECPKGRVYSLRSLGRKKRTYVDPDASTSQQRKYISIAD